MSYPPIYRIKVRVEEVYAPVNVCDEHTEA